MVFAWKNIVWKQCGRFFEDFSPGEFNRNNKSLIGDLYSSAKTV
jgi:hypothetical protein